MEGRRPAVLRVRRQAERRHMQTRHRQGSRFRGDHDQQSLPRGSVTPRGGRHPRPRFQTGPVRRRRPGLQFRAPVRREHQRARFESKSSGHECRRFDNSQGGGEVL